MPAHRRTGPQRPPEARTIRRAIIPQLLCAALLCAALAATVAGWILANSAYIGGGALNA